MSVLLKGGHLPVEQVAIACRTHCLGFISEQRLSHLEAAFWHSVCRATASIAADTGVFSAQEDAEVAEDALIALTPEGCEQWSSLVFRHMRVCTHEEHAEECTEGRPGTWEAVREILAAMVACVDFDDDANRNGAMMICEQLVQEICLLACASSVALWCL
jgi:hypothetical protein